MEPPEKFTPQAAVAKVPLTPCEENGHFPEPRWDTEEGKYKEMWCRVCKRRMREA